VLTYNERLSKVQKREYAAQLEEQIRVARERKQKEHQVTYGQVCYLVMIVPFSLSPKETFKDS
jgi:hypothetical protein